MARQGVANQALQGQALDHHLLLDDAAAKFLERGGRPAGLVGAQHAPGAQGGAHHRRPGGARSTQVTHVAEAMQYRRALRTS